MKKAEEVMEILEAYDATGTLRGAAGLAGCDHKTVGHYVREREAAEGTWKRSSRPRPRREGYEEKVAELVAHSKAAVRADKVHERLAAMGYEGSERTTRRAVAEAKRNWHRQNGRVSRPWTPEPGLWLQWDYGEGPVIGGRRTSLFCAWLAWSRYRIVIPLLDRTLPSVVMALDRTLREIGGAPTYVLTDNEKTVTTTHVCQMPVRNPEIVRAARHYGLAIETCVPADPESKGGSEATVRIAKANLVPTDHNLRDAYASFSELDESCRAFCEKVNARVHRITRRRPAEMLGEEQGQLKAIPPHPHTICFGETRRVRKDATVTVAGCLYSVPHELLGERVWVRSSDRELIVVHAEADDGPREVARHKLTTPGNPRIEDSHYPPRPPGALKRRPSAQNHAEREFLEIGPAAEGWLIEASRQGTGHIRSKMANAVDLARLHGASDVDEALRIARRAGRFASGDLASILAYRSRRTEPRAPGVLRPPPAEGKSLQGGTRVWEAIGR